MILITIGLMCLLELKKEQQDQNRKNSAEKFFLIKNVFYRVVLKQKTYLFKNHFLNKLTSLVSLSDCFSHCRSKIWWKKLLSGLENWIFWLTTVEDSLQVVLRTYQRRDGMLSSKQISLEPFCAAEKANLLTTCNSYYSSCARCVCLYCNAQRRVSLFNTCKPSGVVSNGYTSKCSGSYWSNPPFLVFDIGHSGTQDWLPECPNVKKIKRVI